jgi:translocator protein
MAVPLRERIVPHSTTLSTLKGWIVPTRAPASAVAPGSIFVPVEIVWQPTKSFAVMSLIFFLVLTIGGGLLIGFLTRPDDWFAALSKPSFMPPSWIFGPVWTVLYVLIAIAGWRTFLRDPHGAAMLVWSIALLLNFSWSPTFFRLHRPLAALVVVFALLAAIVAFIVLTWPGDILSALLFVLYAAWVTFATTLNATIWWLNS